MSRTWNVGAAIALLIWASGRSDAAAPGKIDGQERSDIVFRTLQSGADEHSAVYIAFRDEDEANSAKPNEQYLKHDVIEMVGVVRADIIVRETLGIKVRDFQQFRTATTYLGAFSNIRQTVIKRGRNGDMTGSRMAILNVANRLRNRTIPIDYVVRDGDLITRVAVR